MSILTNFIDPNPDIKFGHLKEFKKELKKFSKKKCKSIYEDIEILKKAMRVKIPEQANTIPISNLGGSVKVPIYKVRQFRCRDIKKGSNSGFRIIYAFIEDSSTVIFIEIYHKNKKANEDRKRIKNYFSE